MAPVTLALALSVVGAPLTAEAQQAGKSYHIGFLAGGARPADAEPPKALRDALQELGYVEGKTVRYTGRWAEAKLECLPKFAAELVQLKVNLIVTIGGPASEAAARATATIPIVTAGAGDVVGTGLVASLARPGGNLTGITDQAIELSAKRLEMLKEAVPKALRVAVLWNADDLAMTLRYREIDRAAHTLGVTIQPLGVREPNDFDAAFSAMVRDRPDALFLVTDSLTILHAFTFTVPTTSA